MTDARAHADVRVPPPLIYLAFFAAGSLLERALRLHVPGDGRGLATAGISMIVTGFLLALWSAVSLRRARTTVLPTRPSTTVVAGGPYRFTRNPIYLGVLLIYSGCALWLDYLWPLLLLAPLVLVLSTAVIKKEEVYLATRFGAEYESYTRRVRRWV